MPLAKIIFILNYFDDGSGWANNRRPTEAAQEWIDCGFTPEEVWRYLEARCADPRRTAELKAAGITPEIAAQDGGLDEDGLAVTLGEGYCWGGG